MPVLVLVNGPPASGKSTIAARLVAVRPLALDLDIDVVRGLLGAWLDDPTTAGRAARALAMAMARTHLSAGHDVVVPQFLGRIEFITELESLAAQTGAHFVEIGLVMHTASPWSGGTSTARLQQRSGSSVHRHVDRTASPQLWDTPSSRWEHEFVTRCRLRRGPRQRNASRSSRGVAVPTGRHLR